MSYTFLSLAHDVLKEASHPLTYGEIWQCAQDAGLNQKLRTKGKTPWNTVGAHLSSNILHDSDSIFIKVGSRPQRYFLKSRQSALTPDWLEKAKQDHVERTDRTSRHEGKFAEKALHPLLAYLAYNNPVFSNQGAILTKTIAHEQTRGNKLNQWMHPDMVGVYFPFEDFERESIALNKHLNPDSVIHIFSFELKKKITRGNYRECFFQTVSNSSWAHTSYLVAAEISNDEDLHLELERLSNAFGIGVIHLNLDDFDASDAVYPAKFRPVLDWETINKLCAVNDEFRSFLDRVRTDLEAGRAHVQEYDKIPEDPAKYIRKILKG